MRQKGIRWAIWFWIINLGFGLAAPAGKLGALDLKDRFLQNPGVLTRELELAKFYYESAGFSDYFQVKSLWWTENAIRASDLRKKGPALSPSLAEEFRRRVITILEAEPNNTTALIMAGNYHLAFNQRETALWYYQRAAQIVPSSLEVCLALADYYLDGCQPMQALQILQGFEDQLAAFRKGEAYLQLGDYYLALGFLLQAGTLPGGFQITRDKDLFKVYLAFGEPGQAGRLIINENILTVQGILLRELQGWLAWWDGDSQAALESFQLGSEINRDYRYWVSDILVLKQGTIPASDFPDKLGDTYLNSVSKIFLGQVYWKTGQLDQAYRFYLDATKLDRSTLVGFLMAGDVLLKQKQYAKALQTFSQGLEINPVFSPLLAKRVEVFEKLGETIKTVKEVELLNKSFEALKSSSKISGTLTGVANGKIILTLKGTLRNMVGLWASSDGLQWDWYQWWGGPLIFKGSVRHLWIVPVGAGLSGEALYIEVKPRQNNVMKIKATIQPDRMVAVKLPFEARLILDGTGDKGLTASFFSDNLSAEHFIPLKFFTGENRKFRVWFQKKDQSWGQTRLELEQSLTEAPESPDDERYHSFPTGQIVGLDRSLPEFLTVESKVIDFYKLQLCWTATEPVTGSLRLLSDQGEWEETLITPDSTGCFQAVIPLRNCIRCRIVIQDRAGNFAVREDPEVNLRLRETNIYQFLINKGQMYTNSRNITVSLLDQEPDLKWALSNNLRTWSPWRTGENSSQWRIEPGDGEKYIYIKYQLFTGQTKFKIAVVPVYLDTHPPEIKEISSQPVGDQLLITAFYDEPVKLKVFTGRQEELPQGEIFSSLEFQDCYAVRVRTNGSGSGYLTEFEATDRAGNITERFYQMEETVLIPVN